MCRLFGMAAPSPSPIRWALSSAENSLERQSTRHPDGWGLASFDEDAASLYKGSDPAFADGDYRTTLRDVEGDHVIAHVRRATVGARFPRNNHPFRCGPWIFAHNGTLSQIETIRGPILDHLPDDLEARIGGETDSELLFHLVMAYLRDAEGTLDTGLEAAGRATRKAVRHVAELDEEHDADSPSEMNVLLTRGEGFVATRYGRSLFVLDEGKLDPANHSTDAPNLDGSVAVASERVASLGAWSEVPEESLLVLRPGEPAKRHELRPRTVA